MKIKKATKTESIANGSIGGLQLSWLLKIKFFKRRLRWQCIPVLNLWLAKVALIN